MLTTGGFRPSSSTPLMQLAHHQPKKLEYKTAENDKHWEDYAKLWNTLVTFGKGQTWVDAFRWPEKKTALHIACSSNNKIAIRALFAMGAGPLAEFWV